LPHAQIMCAQPTRKAINNCEWVRIPPLKEFIRLSESAAAPLRAAPVIAVALNTFDLDESDAQYEIERTAKETGLPTTDPVRYDPAPIVDAIERFHRDRERRGHRTAEVAEHH